MKLTQVIGRNGCLYPATHISGNVYQVGLYLVIVEEEVVRETICRATRKSITEVKNRCKIVG